LIAPLPDGRARLRRGPFFTASSREKYQLVQGNYPRLELSSPSDNVVDLAQHHVWLLEVDVRLAHSSAFLLSHSQPAQPSPTGTGDPYEAVSAAGPVTGAELAARTGTAEAYVSRWLVHQAAGGYLEYDPTTSRYSLPPEHAAAWPTSARHIHCSRP